MMNFKYNKNGIKYELGRLEEDNLFLLYLEIKEIDYVVSFQYNQDEDEIEAAIAEQNESDDVESEEVENIEDSEASSEEEPIAEDAPKPKRRRSKKVTPPEELEGSNEEISGECNNEEHYEEHHENEVFCENQEA